MAKELDHEVDPREALIRWHLASGVDALLDEMPHDRFSEKPAADIVAANPESKSSSRLMPKPVAPLRGAATPILAGGSSDEWAQKAHQQAQAASNLTELRAALEGFEGIALKRTARNLLIADNVVPGGIIILGDLPEADDERSGEIFSGRAGVLLDLMLGSIGLSRDHVALTMSVPWRPPGNRAPTTQELSTLAPFLRRQLQLLQPKLILSFGTSGAQMLGDRSETILKLRGQWLDLALDDKTVPMLVTFGPGHLLRHPAQKLFAWRDLKALRDRLLSLPKA
ncbi:MAG: uracil-DNA glycosylase [Alphaproteobacteria bacterium]